MKKIRQFYRRRLREWYLGMALIGLNQNDTLGNNSYIVSEITDVVDRLMKGEKLLIHVKAYPRHHGLNVVEPALAALRLSKQLPVS